MNQHTASWPDADLAQLLLLLDAGKSATQIGAIMRRPRNSIIGKVHRLQAAGARIAFARAPRAKELPARRAPAVKPKVKKERAPSIEARPMEARANRIASLEKARAAKAAKHAAKQHLHAGNIARKADSRRHDPGFVEKAVAHPVKPLMVKLVDLTAEQCKWPIGDPRDDGMGFCGHPRTPGCPYCNFHRSLAYYTVERRRAA